MTLLEDPGAPAPARVRGAHRDLVATDRVLRMGVEHELRLWHGPEQADFRLLVGRLAGSLPTLDPGDPRARRLPSGVSLTADGREAELATPPLPLGADTPLRIDALLRRERTELRDRAADGHGVTTVTGFSSHLNISVDDRRVVALGRAFADLCAPAFAALVEPPGSSGLLVRPRRGRLEVGCEYVEGEHLVAALTLLAACAAGVANASAPPLRQLPVMVPSREKFGWFLPPGRLSDEDALLDVWSWARPWARLLGLDVEPVDELVDRPDRRRDDTAGCSFGDAGADDALEPTAGGRAAPGQGPGCPAAHVGPRVLGCGLEAATEWLTWSHVVWRIGDLAGRECRAVLPVEREAEFLSRLDAGSLDRALTRFLRRRPRRDLLVHAQLGTALLWHGIRPGALVPAERRLDGTVPRVSRRRARRAFRAAPGEVRP